MHLHMCVSRKFLLPQMIPPIDMYTYMSICCLLIDPLCDASAHVCFEEVPVYPQMIPPIDMYIYMSICFLLIDPLCDASTHVCLEEVPVPTDDPSPIHIDTLGVSYAHVYVCIVSYGCCICTLFMSMYVCLVPHDVTVC